MPIPRRILHLLQAWFPALAVCVLIFALSQDSHSGRHSHEVLGWILAILGDNTRHYHLLLDGPFRKFAHVVVYFLLGATVYRGFSLGRPDFDTPAAVRTVLFVFLYAATDEYHQSLIPGRGPDLRDVLLDGVAGILALFALWLWLRPWRPRRAALPGGAQNHTD